jgi:hypothetical protein
VQAQMRRLPQGLHMPDTSNAGANVRQDTPALEILT